MLSEVKLVFREISLASAFAEVLAQSKMITGFSVINARIILYQDEYYADSCEHALKEAPHRVFRRRQVDDREATWQEKTRELGEGNDWAYKTQRRFSGGAECAQNLNLLLCVQVKRVELTLKSPTGSITIDVDRCIYSSPDGRELGAGIEVEVKAAEDCSDMPPLVEYLRGAYSLIPARRSKLERGIALLGNKHDKPRKVILDMDPGVDDAIAILLALASPELEVIAITTVAGNVDLENTTRNARLVVDAAQKLYSNVAQPLVAMGLTPAGDLPDASDVHGPDGLGGYASKRKGDPKTKLCEESAPELIARLLHESPGEVTIIATGPLTNIAACARQYPLALAQAQELIAMGGVFFQEGNRSAAAEFNIHRDPESAKHVVEFSGRRRAPGAPVNLPLTFVGLDVTHRVRLLENDLRGRSAKAGFLRNIAEIYMKFYDANEGLRGCYLHDPLAVALAIQPSLCEIEPFFVEVETRGEYTAGETIADMRPTRKFADPKNRVTHVCVSVDADRAKRFVLDRVLSGR